MNNKYDPCHYLEHDDGSKSIFLSNFDEFVDLLEEEGGQGGGHSWESIARAVMEMRAVRLPDMEFDCEGDMFCAVSKNSDELAVVASIVRDLMASPELMSQAIETAVAGDYFE